MNMKKITLSAFLLLFLLPCCDNMDFCPSPDQFGPNAKFMADDTPRWETGTTVEESHQTPYTFITDKGGNLFSPSPSSNYKTGRITKDDGTEFEIIEIPGTIAKGKFTGAKLHTALGEVTLARLEIVKKDGDKLWIVFQESEGSPERRVVQ
jgi:hypothetical protein